MYLGRIRTKERKKLEKYEEFTNAWGEFLQLKKDIYVSNK